MMLGEISYTDLQFPNDLRLQEDKINEEEIEPRFPITAHLTLILFIFVFSLVIMNLLVGIAVSDISKLFKNSRRNQLMAQVELANSVLSFSKTNTFKYLLSPYFKG